ncbi:TlpA family protein disulfide reductase [Algoriphagus antarcticus]|uniref:Thiol-disulfide isomerase/thioredoxin n=1 Tax=Algoriphagus antarcticus TaxID=238540 RepID=A0A3E0DRQ6_9BACT|nr:TlpA disulfide reductase family protein [Algoriphagus antarcticus]REG84541.1 thiol-disulfide isomerase/thioredoxin [Algoriphagus antarcticus]
MKFLLFILLFFASCSVKTNKDTVNVSYIDDEKDLANLTLIYKSDNDSIYEIEKNQSLEDLLEKGSKKINLIDGDTLTVILESEMEIIHAKTLNVIDMVSFIVNSYDTIYINKFKGATEIYKLIKDQKKSVIWMDSLLIKKNNSYNEMIELYNKFYDLRVIGVMEFYVPNLPYKDQWDSLIHEYISVNYRYYKFLSDSIKALDKKGDILFIELLRAHQYKNLSSVNRLVSNPILSKLLIDDFVNVYSFKNKNLSSIIASYFTYNFIRNKDVSLKDAYLNGFAEYPEELRQYFKFRSITGMNDYKFSRETIIEFVDEYGKEFNSTKPLSSLLSEIEYGVIVDLDLILQDHNGNETKWIDLLKKWRGDLVYVDFWASWCAPCIRAMPYSKELKAKLKDKDVTFVYLAFNDKEDAWKTMSEKHKIGENNFLILNSRSSGFVEDIKLDAIPRYMIYDIGGKLIHLDAPGPDQKEAFEVLTSYLKD